MMKKLKLTALLGFIFSIACIGCNNNQKYQISNLNNDSDSSVDSEEKFEVQWKNYDGVLLSKEEYDLGEMPVYRGNTPTKPSDDKYSYQFDGWSPSLSVVASNCEYTAKFKSTPIKNYTIEWRNYNDVLLETDQVSYLETPNYDGNTPVKESDEQYSYTFKGWDKEIVPATEDVVYKAVFDEKVNYYSIDVKCTNCSIAGQDEFVEYKNYGDTVTYQFDRKSSQKYFYPKSIQYIVDGEQKTDGYDYDELTGKLTFEVNGNTVINAVSSELTLTKINLDVISPGTFSFECDNLDFVNWGDGTINKQNSHTYNNVGNDVSISIYGNIDNFKITSSDSNSFKFDIVLSDSNTVVPENAYLNSGITSAIIPDSVTFIDKSAFAGCSSLEYLSVPFVGDGTSNNTYFAYLFGGASWTDYNKVPSTLRTVNLTKCEKIADRAFYLCDSLYVVNIPNTVVSIGKEAFYQDYLKEVHIPSSVESIGEQAFRYSNPSSITVDPGNTNFDSRNNCNAIIETSSNKLILGGNNTQIPTTVTSIGKYAFTGTHSGNDLVIPDNITNIEKAAFGGTFNYQSIYLPIISHMYYGYMFGADSYSQQSSRVPSIPKIILGNKIDTIPDSCFFGCNKIKTVVVSNSVTYIGNRAFENCSQLSLIDLSDLDREDRVPQGNMRMFEGTQLSTGKCIKVRNKEMLDAFSKEEYWSAYSENMFYE